MRDDYARSQGASGAAQCMKAEPTPQTAENVIDQEIARLLGLLHRLATVKVNTPAAVLRQSASNIRELAALL